MRLISSLNIHFHMLQSHVKPPGFSLLFVSYTSTSLKRSPLCRSICCTCRPWIRGLRRPTWSTGWTPTARPAVTGTTDTPSDEVTKCSMHMNLTLCSEQFFRLNSALKPGLIPRPQLNRLTGWFKCTSVTPIKSSHFLLYHWSTSLSVSLSCWVYFSSCSANLAQAGNLRNKAVSGSGLSCDLFNISVLFQSLKDELVQKQLSLNFWEPTEEQIFQRGQIWKGSNHLSTSENWQNFIYANFLSEKRINLMYKF